MAETIKEDHRRATFICHKDHLERVDKMAKQLNMSRSQLLMNLSLMGMEDAMVLDKMGVLPLIAAGQSVRRYLGFKKKVTMQEVEENE